MSMCSVCVCRVICGCYRLPLTHSLTKREGAIFLKKSGTKKNLLWRMVITWGTMWSTLWKDGESGHWVSPTMFCTKGRAMACFKETLTLEWLICFWFQVLRNEPKEGGGEWEKRKENCFYLVCKEIVNEGRRLVLFSLFGALTALQDQVVHPRGVLSGEIPQEVIFHYLDRCWTFVAASNNANKEKRREEREREKI